MYIYIYIYIVYIYIYIYIYSIPLRALPAQTLGAKTSNSRFSKGGCSGNRV